MINKLIGRAWVFEDNINTDIIIAGPHCCLPTPEDMSIHCMEDIRPDFAKYVKEGDIIIAGKNFGCGSSREQATECILALGIRCIIAETFGRIFYRNCINNGMYLLEQKNINEICNDGDLVEVEINKHIKVNGIKYPIHHIPDEVGKIINAGGLINYYRIKNRKKAEQ